MAPTSRPLVLLAGVLLLGCATGCANNGSGTALTTATVRSGADSCTVSDHQVPKGKVTLDIHNTGSQATAVYVYGRTASGRLTDVKGKQESIGPGTSQQLTLRLGTGQYRVVCRPGGSGKGISAPLRVVSDEADSTRGPKNTTVDADLRFAVAADGTVTPPAHLRAGAHDEVKLVLRNRTGSAYVLQLSEPGGDTLVTVRAPARHRAQANALLTGAGTYQVRVSPAGRKSGGQRYTLKVTQQG